MTPQETKIVSALEAIKCKPVVKRLMDWPDVLKLFTVAIVQNRAELSKHAELAGKTTKAMKLAGMAREGVYATSGEAESAYMGACRAAEALLVPFGFEPIMVTIGQYIMARDSEAQQAAARVSKTMGHVFEKMGKLLPWRPTIQILPEEEPTVSGWDGTGKILYLTIVDADRVLKNMSTMGMYTVLCGQIIPMMCTGPKPIAAIQEVLSFTALLGIQLGAVTERVDVKPAPIPDIYRGKAKVIFELLRATPQSLPALTSVTAEALRILHMINTDGSTYGWRLTHHAETKVYSLITT